MKITRILPLVLLFVLTLGLFSYAGYRSFRKGSASGLTLDNTVTEWSIRAGLGDSSVYLRVANNIALGRGIVDCTEAECTSGKFVPFVFWAPGAPWIFGNLIKLFHRNDMYPFFGFLCFPKPFACFWRSPPFF